MTDLVSEETVVTKGFPEFPEFYKDSKYRDPMGRLLSSKLFYERTDPDKRNKVLYTLKDQDHEGFKSLYLLYMDANDPTEYTFASTCFESYDHWITITTQEWFKPYVERYRKELETRIRSSALKNLIRESKSGSKNAFAANKFLIERGWLDKVETKAVRGRPSKEEIKKAAYDIADEKKTVDEDYLRVVGK